MAKKNKYDIIFKNRLKNNFFELLVNFSDEKLSNYTQITPQPVQFAQPLERDADFVFLATAKDKETVFHLEIQTGNDNTMLNRMLTYLALLNERHYEKKRKIPLFFKQILLYLGKKESAGKCTMPSKKDFGSFVYEYQLIDITKISYKDFLTNPEMYVFAILGDFEGKDESTVVDEIAEKAAKHYKTKEYLKEFVTDLATLGGLRKLKTKIIHNPTIMALHIDIKDHEFYVEGKLEGNLEGELKGELNKALTIGEAMLIDKMPIEQVVKFTGLTFEQIKSLQADLEK